MESIQIDIPSLSEQMLGLLYEAECPLSTRDLGSRLRFQDIGIADYQVAAHLRTLFKNGDVLLEGNKWRPAYPPPVNSRPKEGRPQVSPLAFPILTPLTIERLGWQPKTIEDPEISYTEPQASKRSDEKPSFTGRWALFRRLVAYYRQCIRNEEGAKAFAYQNEIHERFIYLRKVGFWHPKDGMVWQAIIPLGEHLSGLVNNLPGPTDEDTLVVGYPVQAYYKEREGEPPITIIRPIIYFPVEYEIAREGLLVRNDSPKMEVNFDWLEFAFKKRGDRQGSFLSACGFINRSRPNDEASGIERGEASPNIEGLTSALKAFMPDKIVESLRIDAIPDSPLRTPFESGIYNRAVLMVAKKTRFTVTLLKELAAIERASEKVLDQTALRAVFVQEDQEKKPLDDLIHEETVIDTTLLNADQRLAVASLLERPLTVVTGPPGTGKSQVVSAAALNARLQNQSLLFASRNHKAIDAVYHRLVNEDGWPLMVRTNSKEDPNLNYTFSHAIKEMLHGQSNPDASQRLTFEKEEIFQLLRQRGETAHVTRKVALIGTELGRLEEKIGYLSRTLPHGMPSYLDAKPSHFPYKSVARISYVAKVLAQASTRSSIVGKMGCYWRCIMLIPWYRLARKRLRAVPGIPSLRPWPTPKVFQDLFNTLILLEKAAEYARLRIKCGPFEEEARNHPPLEELTALLSEATQRLEEIVPRAIDLDLNGRQGLPADVSREEMAGLGPAIKAMRTGLDEGRFQAEATAILQARAPHVLSSFPCWAVTNLSAGSRLPLMAGLFDIVIVDEASQSDIPSAIPLLFRAKRAGVVGDPFQLTHCSKLSTAKDTLLRREIGIKRVDDARFAYSDHSLYDLFAGTNDVEPVFSE
jgi:hypothetical protein